MDVSLATAVLGVRADAPAAEVKRAYHTALRRVHPDAGGSGDPAGLSAVMAAYSTLRVQRPSGVRQRRAERQPLIDVYA